MRGVKSELRLQLEKMEIGDIIELPKECRSRLWAITVRLQETNRHYIIRGRKHNENLTVKRLQ